MAVTDQQLIDLIVAEVGDDAAGTVGRLIGTLWEVYADKARVAPRLRYLYAKRASIDALLGSVREAVTFVDGDARVELIQKTANLRAMRGEVQAEIAAVEARARAGRGAATGALTATAPVDPPAGGRVDANDRRYRGDAYPTLPGGVR